LLLLGLEPPNPLSLGFTGLILGLVPLVPAWNAFKLDMRGRFSVRVPAVGIQYGLWYTFQL
jgi:hypothetical protein